MGPEKCSAGPFIGYGVSLDTPTSAEYQLLTATTRVPDVEEWT